MTKQAKINLITNYLLIKQAARASRRAPGASRRVSRRRVAKPIPSWKKLLAGIENVGRNAGRGVGAGGRGLLKAYKGLGAGGKGALAGGAVTAGSYALAKLIDALTDSDE